MDLNSLSEKERFIIMETVLSAYKYQEEIGYKDDDDNWLCQFTSFIKAGYKLNDVQANFAKEKLMPYTDKLIEIINKNK